MRRQFLVLLTLLFLCSCAKPQAPHPSARLGALPQTNRGWWYARFEVFWPQDSKPKWYVDALIAEEIIKPILEKNKKEIELWRFHRRAARDNAGHQFSFIFYASAPVADRIYENIRNDSLVQQLIDNGILVCVRYDDTSVISRPYIQDTSDPNWSIEIQKSWPYFIMGASRMWLDTLTQISLEYTRSYSFITLDEKLKAYQDIYDSMTYLWQEQCGHALLHHLYALYGYVPVKVRQVDMLMRF